MLDPRRCGSKDGAEACNTKERLGRTSLKYQAPQHWTTSVGNRLSTSVNSGSVTLSRGHWSNNVRVKILGPETVAEDKRRRCKSCVGVRTGQLELLCCVALCPVRSGRILSRCVAT